MSPLSLLFYVGLFLAICIFVVLILALINIQSKSYNPKNSYPVILILLILFVFNGFMALTNLNRALQLAEQNLTRPNTPGQGSNLTF